MYQEVLFDVDSIDPKFTTRSVILQLLMQACGEKVDNYIDDLLKEYRPGSFLSPEEAMAVCLMYLYTIENILLASDAKLPSKGELLVGATTKLKVAKKILTIHSEHMPVTSLAQLKAIAEARCGLFVASQCIYDMAQFKGKEKHKGVDQLLDEAQTFCLESICQQEARLFLLKLLCHTYNTEILADLSWHPPLNWILTSELKGRVQRVFDGFVVTGATYTNVRDKLYKSVSTRDIQPFKEAVQALDCSNNQKEAAVLLAIFREVTLTNASLLPEMQVSDEIKSELSRTIQQEPYKNTELGLRLVGNSLSVEASEKLVVAQKQSYDHQMIIAIVVHSLVAVLCSTSHLREPLESLLSTPRDMRESQLLIRILKEARDSSDPEDAFFRLIVYSITLGAAVSNARAVKDIIPSRMYQDVNLGDFLWQAILSEMKSIKDRCRMSESKCALLVHLIINNVLMTQPKKQKAIYDSAIKTSSDYRRWKRDFIATFITPVMRGNVSEQCLNAERILQADKKDIVLQVLNKSDSRQSVTMEDVQRLATLPIVWQYQPPINVSTLHRYMESEQKKSGQEQYQLLNAFIQQEPVLRAMVYLPDIIRLQRRLIEQYHRCIDLAEAWKLSAIHDTDEKTQRLMESFLLAWNLVMGAEGNQFGASTSIPPEYKRQLALEDCKLAVFLPTSTGDGVCSTEMVKFLIERHNAFIQFYLDLRRSKVKRTISPGSVTTSHLVAYDLNKELLPLIHAHCHRTSGYGGGKEEGGESTLTFSLDNLERAIEDHYIRGRPLIDGRLEELLFREGALSYRVFQTIREKVPQDTLSLALRKDILSELNSITALRDCLDVSETVIGFLASTGGDPDMYIKDYLENVLSLPKEQQLQLNPKAHHCRLRHALSLWQVLSVERAIRRLASKKQDPFEGIEKKLRKPLTEIEEEGVLEGLRYVHVDDFLTELYEFIELQLKATYIEATEGPGKPLKLLDDEIGDFLRNKKRHLHGFRRMQKRLRNLKLSVFKAVDVWRLVAQSKAY